MSLLQDSHRAHIQRHARMHQSSRALVARNFPHVVLADEPQYEPDYVIPCRSLSGLPELPEKPDMGPSLRSIVREVCRYYCLSPIDILSARRTRDVVQPRQVAMYLAKTLTLRSLPDIGRRLGGKDHTTILHGVRKIAAMEQYDSALAADIVSICAKLGVSREDV